MEHKKGAGGLEEAGKTVAIEGGRHPGVSPVLKGSETGGTDFWVRDLGVVRCDDAGGGGKPHGVYKADQWEAGTESGRR